MHALNELLLKKSNEIRNEYLTHKSSRISDVFLYVLEPTLKSKILSKSMSNWSGLIGLILIILWIWLNLFLSSPLLTLIFVLLISNVQPLDVPYILQ